MIIQNNKAIIKNALSNENKKYIQDIYQGYNIPWSYNDGVLEFKNPIDFQVEDIVMNAGLEKGDTLITGGMSSYFPLGIPLGKITDFERNIQSGYYTISTELFENPSQVYYVYVIENLEVKEINGLNKELPK